MKTYRLPHTDLEVSRLAYGCMNIGGEWSRAPLSEAAKTRAARLVDAAREQGINCFDHADIYAYGKSEAVFGEVLRQQPALRAQIVIQSKCGIRFDGDPRPGDPGRYDFSAEHILRSVEDSLRRLNTDYLDVLLLHRPDPLVEPEEVARAFDALQSAGKVRAFGVSNHTATQMALLKKAVRQPIVVNQVELSLLHPGLIEAGIMANQDGGQYTGADGMLDYCRLNDILVQAWAPVAGGRLIDPPARAERRERAVAAKIAELARTKGTSRQAIALAWLLRHPAGIQPIIGTTNAERLVLSCQADHVTLSRDEWYALLIAARGAPVP